MEHKRCEIDRRSVRARLSDKGQHIRTVVSELFGRHSNGILGKDVLGDLNLALHRLERYWGDQIRYIY